MKLYLRLMEIFAHEPTAAEVWWKMERMKRPTSGFWHRAAIPSPEQLLRSLR